MPGLNMTVRTRRRSTTAATTTTRIRHLAHGGLTRDLDEALRRGTENADRYADEEAVARLPKRRGFAAGLAGKTEMHRSRISGGYRLTVDGKGADVAAINRGRLRHPVHGNREVWVTQTVRPRFADDALARVKADVDRELREAMDGGR